jgi:hypothetical protein
MEELDKYGIFFREIRPKSKMCFMYHPLFVLRRLVFCLSTFVLVNQPSL